jgi:hypothetical protein
MREGTTTAGRRRRHETATDDDAARQALRISARQGGDPRHSIRCKKGAREPVYGSGGIAGGLAPIDPVGKVASPPSRHRMLLSRVSGPAAAVLLLAIGCGGGAEDDSAPPAATPPRVSAAAPAVARDRLGAGDLRIVTVDSSIDLALLGDAISTGLSPYTLAKVRRETDTGAVQGSGFGASIERMVKRSVSSAVGTRVSFPLTAVKAVHYTGGMLQFEWTGKPVSLFENTKVNGRPVLAAFPPDEAQRFADAVNARKALRTPAR